jgi:dienelactone hydrolase
MVRPITPGLVAVAACCMLWSAVRAEPSRVTFASADGRTTLVGYLFEPASKGGARRPAVVMMHGRAGAYSSLAHDVFDASTLSQRHRAWGERWAEQGYVALLVDGFGPRGYPQGFGPRSYDLRRCTQARPTISTIQTASTRKCRLMPRQPRTRSCSPCASSPQSWRADNGKSSLLEGATAAA